MKAFGKFFGEVIKITLISLLIILPVRYFVAQPFFVRGASMDPSLQNGDYLIVDEISYRLRDPQRGDVVVFRVPRDNSQFLIKRIIGLPGETVEIRDGGVFVRKSPESLPLKLSEPYLNGAFFTAETVMTHLKADEVFVLGDNRNASYDSRQWGTLPVDKILGRAWVRAWPLGSFNFISAPQYIPE